MRFGILGPLLVRDHAGSIPIRAAKHRGLLAVLLVHANQVVSVDELIELLWPTSLPGNPRKTLQVYVAQLRQLLHRGQAARAGPLVRQAPGYLLEVAPGALDLHRFEYLVRQARQAHAQGDPAEAAGCLRRALGLWRGRALEDVEVDALQQRVVPTLEEARLAALEDHLDADLALGRSAQLVGELRQLTAEHPLRERLHGQLALALYRAGRQADALAALRAVRRTLVDELGLEPGAALQKLERSILRCDPGLDLATIPAAPSPSSPFPLCQLPPDTDDLTGLDQLVADLADGLGGAHASRGAPRVVVITGPAGVGKTALMVRLAHRVRRRFPDGQLFVQLRGADTAPRDPAEVLAELLRTLGLAGGMVPESLTARAGALRARLTDRKVLLLLDDAATTAQVRPLLPGSPSCAVIVTSRPSLGGLAVTRTVSLDVLDTRQAVALLERCAGPERVQREAQAAVLIARSCGGLPLALRIAASRLATQPHQSLAQLADRLADERRLLDELAIGDLAVSASFALSYQALDQQERRLWRLLGALSAGDFTPRVAAALLDVPVRRAEELLEHLVEARLLEAAATGPTGQVRYRFHDLLRAYACERLASEESPEARRAAVERALHACAPARRP
jgi:DNA-binding SARP family transcriptional activator